MEGVTVVLLAVLCLLTCTGGWRGMLKSSSVAVAAPLGEGAPALWVWQPSPRRVPWSIHIRQIYVPWPLATTIWDGQPLFSKEKGLKGSSLWPEGRGIHEGGVAKQPSRSWVGLATQRECRCIPAPACWLCKTQGLGHPYTHCTHRAASIAWHTGGGGSLKRGASTQGGTVTAHLYSWTGPCPWGAGVIPQARSV